MLEQRVKDDAVCELMQLVLEGAEQDQINELVIRLHERLRDYSGPPGITVWVEWVVGLARTGKRLKHPQVYRDSLVTLLSSKYLNWPPSEEEGKT